MTIEAAREQVFKRAQAMLSLQQRAVSVSRTSALVSATERPSPARAAW